MYRLRLLEIKSLRPRLASFTHPTALNEPQKAISEKYGNVPNYTHPTFVFIFSLSLSLSLSCSLSLSTVYIFYLMIYFMPGQGDIDLR